MHEHCRNPKKVTTLEKTTVLYRSTSSLVCGHVAPKKSPLRRRLFSWNKIGFYKTESSTLRLVRFHSIAPKKSPQLHSKIFLSSNSRSMATSLVARKKIFWPSKFSSRKQSACTANIKYVNVNKNI